jgi:cell division protein FtsW
MMISITAFVNIGVVIGILPTTGIPLPFVSFGGTAIVFASASIGIIINVAFTEIKNQELKSSIFDESKEVAI